MSLIEALQNPALYDHEVEGFEVIETHISWVILTGPFAYKIKKPLNLGFLDFSTLEKRRFFCQEEVRLNQRLAPRIYVKVVAITGTPEAPRLDGEGEAIEYAVKMVQFPQEVQLDRMLERGELAIGLMDRLAEVVADFHARIPKAGPDTPFGTPERVYHPVKENFEQTRPLLEDPELVERLERIAAWSGESFRRLEGTLRERKAHGFIRECHGDMHLANMALWRDELIIFDCIEFNENLRFIDVINDVAFAVMDMDARGIAPYGRRFINAYLERTGDYGGLALLRFYQTYRAMVRAKVAAIRLHQGADAKGELSNYLALAEACTHPPSPVLIITHGFSGSGKTTLTQSLVEAMGAMRLRSDVERKRLFGLPPQARTGSGLESGIYTHRASHKTYERLAELAEKVLRAGYGAIVDATFLKEEQREAFRELAAFLHVPFLILDFKAPRQVLEERLRRRKGDASEADIRVLRHQFQTNEPFADEEEPYVLPVDAQRPLDVEAVRKALEKTR